MNARIVPPVTTTVLVAGCVLVIAVHVVDDSFVQPQPGMSARDHLISGLVPLAVLGLASLPFSPSYLLSLLPSTRTRRGTTTRGFWRSSPGSSWFSSER